MKFIVAVLAALMLAACGQREVVSTDTTTESSTVVTNTDTSATVTPGTTAVAPTGTETVAPSKPVNVSTAPGEPSGTKKTKH